MIRATRFTGQSGVAAAAGLPVDRTDALLLQTSNKTPSDNGFEKVLRFYGLKRLSVDLGKVPVTDALLRDEAGAYYPTVFIDGSNLTPALLSGGELQVLRNAITVGGVHLYVGALRSNNNAPLQTLTAGEVLGSTSVTDSNKDYIISSVQPEVTRELSGLTITHNSAQTDFALNVSGSATHTQILVRSTDNSQQLYAIFARYQDGAGSLFVASNDADTYLSYNTIADNLAATASGNSFMQQRFGQIMPMMMFVRYSAGSEAWHRNHDYANFTLDDPPLQPLPTGADFSGILQHAIAHNFHFTLAFIPKNFDSTDPAVVSLFKDNPNRFSVVQHGNNHDGYEFYKYTTQPGDQYPARPLADQEADIVQGMARMQALSQSTGLPISHIMIFPFNISPADTLTMLKKYNFLATINSQDYPLAGARAWTWNSYAYPAEMEYSNFAVIKRYGPDSEPFPIDLFVDRPVFMYEHPPYFTTRGAGAFDGVADSINALQGDVEWRSLDYIMKHLDMEKTDDDGSVEVQFYGNDLIVTNETGDDKTYHLTREETLNVPIYSVTVDGAAAAYSVSGGILQVDTVVAAQGSRELVITYGSPPTATPTPTLTATVRSTLSSTSTSTPTSTPSKTATSTATNTAIPPTATATETSTSTAIPTETSTNTPIISATPSATDSPSATATDSPSATATETSTSTSTPGATDTSTATPTRTDTPSPSSTDTTVATQTSTTVPAPSDTNTPTLTATETASDTPTVTLTPSPTDTETSTPSDTPTSIATVTVVLPTSTSTSTITETASPTETSPLIPTATDTVVPTSSPTETASDTPTGTETPTETVTATPTATGTPVPSATDTSTETPTDSAAPTDTPTDTFTTTATDTSVPTTAPTDTPTDTRTNTPTATDTQTSVPTDTATDTPTFIPTGTATQTLTATDTDTPTDTPTNTATETVTVRPTGTDTPTETATETPTVTPTETGTPVPSSTVTASDTPTDTAAPTDTSTDTSTDTATPSDTATMTATDTQTDTFTPTATDSPTAVPTDTPSQSASTTATDTSVPTTAPTDTPTDTRTDTPTATATSTATDTPTNLPTDTQTATDTPSPIATSTYTVTPSSTETETATRTATQTGTDTRTPTETPTPTYSATTTATDTAVATATATETATASATTAPTDSPTPTSMDTSTATSTVTGTPTPSPTFTATRTAILPSSTATNTPTSTSTSTVTPIPTATLALRLFSDGFETGDLSQWTGGSGLVVQQQEVYAGVYAARGTSLGVASYVYKRLTTNQSDLYYRVRLKSISQGSRWIYPMRFLTAGGGQIIALFLTGGSSSAKVGYQNYITNSSVTSANTVSRGVWHEVEVHVKVAGASSVEEVWLDGVPLTDLSRTDSLGATAVGRVQVGENGTGAPADIGYDDVSVDTSYIVGAQVLRPGSILDWLPNWLFLRP